MIVWRLPIEAREDPFRPPPEPCDVFCLHCGKEFSSDKIRWKRWGEEGFWCCPTPGCDGVGYQFDIFPVAEMGGPGEQETREYGDFEDEYEIDDGPW